MLTDYRISLNLKTVHGLTTFGCFYLGNDRIFAEQTFYILDGDDVISESTVLCIELTSLIDEISLPIKIKHCTLDQLSANIHTLTKELFIQHNLNSPTKS